MKKRQLWCHEIARKILFKFHEFLVMYGLSLLSIENLIDNPGQNIMFKERIIKCDYENIHELGVLLYKISLIKHSFRF